MAEERKSSNTSNGNQSNKRKQDIPLISTVLATTSRYIALSFLAGGISVILSFGIYTYWYFNGEHDYQRALDTYKSMLLHQESLGKWLDVKAVFTLIVTNIQDKLNDLGMFTEDGANSFLTAQRQILDYSFSFSETYKDNVTADNGLFFGAFRNSADYFYGLMMTVLLITLVWLLKMLTIANYLPVYLLAVGFGLSNGLAQRKIDTFKGLLDFQDRIEFFYRKLRLVSITVFFVYVAIPIGVNPLWFFVPSVILTGISVRFLAALYKKYY